MVVVEIAPFETSRISEAVLALAIVQISQHPAHVIFGPRQRAHNVCSLGRGDIPPLAADLAAPGCNCIHTLMKTAVDGYPLEKLPVGYL
jgi:hypothetical protein